MKIFECLDCFKNSYSAASLEMQKDPSCPHCKGTEIREVGDYAPLEEEITPSKVINKARTKKGQEVIETYFAEDLSENAKALLLEQVYDEIESSGKQIVKVEPIEKLSVRVVGRRHYVEG